MMKPTRILTKLRRDERVKSFRVIMRSFLIVFVVTSVLTAFIWVVLNDVLHLPSDDLGAVSAIIESVSAIVGALLVVVQLREDAKGEEHSRMIEQQQFLFDYNKAFIENPDMASVEAALESYDRGEIEDSELITNENRQRFVNYLVYLEGLAPLVLENILNLDIIDDLMAYRFYLAVNNPVVQREELYVWPDYYLGCYKLYKKWTGYRKTHGYEILHEGRSPFDAWPLFDIWHGKALGLPGEVEVRHPKPLEYGRVGELLMQVDPYIYPALLGGSQLKLVMPRLMHSPGSPFAPEHIWVVSKDERVIALMVAYKERVKEPFDWTSLNDPDLELPSSYQDVCSRYLKPMLEEIGDDEAYVACLATDSAFRRGGYAKMLLESFFYLTGKRAVVLDVISDNQPAIELYKKLKFEPAGEVLGYAYGQEVPRVTRMIRLPR